MVHDKKKKKRKEKEKQTSATPPSGRRTSLSKVALFISDLLQGLFGLGLIAIHETVVQWRKKAVGI